MKKSIAPRSKVASIQNAERFLEGKVKDYFNGDSEIVNKVADVTVSLSESDRNCRITVRMFGDQEYADKPFKCFESLFFIYELLGTKKINVDNELTDEGCDTCGHGSSFEATFICKDIDSKIIEQYKHFGLDNYSIK